MGNRKCHSFFFFFFFPLEEIYYADTSSKMKKNHEILHGIGWQSSDCGDILTAHWPAPNAVYLYSTFAVSAHSGFSRVQL